MKEFVILLVAALLVFGCVEPGVTSNNTSTTDPIPVIAPVNNSSVNVSQTEVKQFPSNYTVNLGDTVSVNYTLYVNGTVYDTNNETLAKEVGIYNSKRIYEPFTFQVAFNKGIIDGFIINTVGMAVNETVVYNVDPERGYGPYNPSWVYVVPRYYNKSNFEVVPTSYLEAEGLNTSVGAAYSTPYGDVFINDSNSENITLFYVFITGHQFLLNGIPQEINSTHENYTATIEYLLDVNQSYRLPHPETGAMTPFLVTNKTDQNITLDGNHPLANETLTFRVTLVDVKPYNS